MQPTEDLITIRQEALIRALGKAVARPSDASFTPVSLANELRLDLDQLTEVMEPLIAKKIVVATGGKGLPPIALTPEGLAESSKLLDTTSPERKATKILFIDSEPQSASRLKEAGFSVFEASMGYRTGRRAFKFPPPNEVDFIVVDLRRPACFDRTSWGPGKNDGFQCKVVPFESISHKYFVQNGRRLAEHTIVLPTQLGIPAPGSLGPKDVSNAIVKAGVPCIIFLNREWLSRVEVFPDWCDVSWEFDYTTATQTETCEPLSSFFPEIGTAIKLKTPINQKWKSGPSFSRLSTPFLSASNAIVKNNIGDVFGQFARMGKGSIWLIPETQENAEVIELFALRLKGVAEQIRAQAESPSVVWSDLLRSMMPPVPPKAAPRAAQRTPPKEAAAKRERNSSDPKITVFISHCSADTEIAQRLIDLLRSAIPGLAPQAIRCTSVPGYRLEGGALTDEKIFAELLSATVFIAMLSRESMASTYVLFELGARWGAKQHILPLVVARMKKAELRPPISGLNAHSAAAEDELTQLVDEVAGKLGIELAKPHVYMRQVKALSGASESASTK